MAIAAVSISPVGVGVSVSRYVAAAIAVLESQDRVRWQLDSMFTTLEGDPAELFALIAEMQEAVVPRGPAADVIVMAAAIADFRPKAPPERKIKKDEGFSEIVLEPTHDFLVDLGRAKPPGQVLVGFAAETDDLLENAASKLERKGLDLIVANDVSQADAGFEVDTNRAILLDSMGSVEELPLQTKHELADAILDRVVRRFTRKDP